MATIALSIDDDDNREKKGRSFLIFLTSFTLRLYRASLNAEAISIPLFQRGSTEAAPGRENLEKGEEHVRFSSFREKDGKKVRATETSYFSSFRPFDDPEGKSFLSSSSSFCLSLSRARACATASLLQIEQTQSDRRSVSPPTFSRCRAGRYKERRKAKVFLGVEEKNRKRSNAFSSSCPLPLFHSLFAFGCRLFSFR